MASTYEKSALLEPLLSGSSVSHTSGSVTLFAATGSDSYQTLYFFKGDGTQVDVGGGSTLTADGDSGGTKSVDLATDTFDIVGGTGCDTTIAKSGTDVTLTIDVDLGEATEAAIDVSTDYALFLDGGATGGTRKDSWADVATAQAGTVTTTGIAASSGVFKWDLQNWTASTSIADADLIGIDDGAGGTLRKMTRGNLLGSATAAFSNGLTSTTISGSGAANLASLHCDSVNLDGGNIDGTTIGAAAVAAGSFAALVATTGDFSGNVTMDGNVTLGDAAADVATVTAQLTCSQGALFTLEAQCEAGLVVDGAGEFNGNVTLGNAASDVTTVTAQLTCSQGATFTLEAQCEAGLVVDGLAEFNGSVDLGNATSDTITATGRFDSDLVPSSDSARDLGTSALQWADIHADAGYIDAMTVTGTSTLGAVTATTISGSGAATLASLHCDSVNLDGGNIDGVTIGAASAAAGTFAAVVCTTLSGSGNAQVGGTLTTNGAITINKGGLDVTGATEILDGAFTVGESTGGYDVTMYGTNANDLLLWDASENALIIKDGNAETVRMGGDATTDYAIDVGNGSAGSNNINKIRASAFVTFSDERLKSDVVPMGNALDTINKLKAVNFTWKSDGSRDFGFLAQDMQKIIPQAVHGTDESHLGVDYGRLTSILVSAIQEQSKQISKLEAKLEDK